MENLKKNFEEPVVQIINMCFCENIATSGASACPLNNREFPNNEKCWRCKVIYYTEGSVTSSQIGKTKDDYITGNTTIRNALDKECSGLDLSAQIELYAAKRGCPANLRSK